jgi:hypothetical protein
LAHYLAKGLRYDSVEMTGFFFVKKPQKPVDQGTCTCGSKAKGEEVLITSSLFAIII